MRSYVDEAYLWYDEVPEVDASLPPYNVTPAQVAPLDVAPPSNPMRALKAVACGGTRMCQSTSVLPTAGGCSKSAICCCPSIILGPTDAADRSAGGRSA